MESPAQTAARLTGATPPTPDMKTYITSAFGHPLPSVDHALQVDGRPVSSDSFLFEKQQTFNRAKTLERMVHPAGSGAFGYFQVTNDMSAHTKAAFLNGSGKKTPVFARFSTVTFGKEFPDSGRNPRGFAVKFYTEEGNYDLVGLNWPIFFVRDPLKGPDVIRSQQRDPQNFLLDFDATFDFLAANPESLHAGAMFFSDSATPVGWRHMDGFGCHTFKWVNASGDYVYVKYHYIPAAGKKNFTFDQAERMCGLDPDFAKRDLFEHIESGKTAEWTLHVQIMNQQEADSCPYDPFDVTKVWPHRDFPLHEVGRLVLNRNPENYHRDVEQAAFSPGNLVPGVEPSPDLLLNWRMFFYRDAQYHRLGVNHHQVPVNCPFMAKFLSPQSRDGALRADHNGAKLPHIAASIESHRQKTMPEKSDYLPVSASGMKIARSKSSRHEGTDSELDQVRQFFRAALDEEGRDHLFLNTAKCLRFASATVKDAYLGMLGKIDGAYRQGVERALDVIKMKPSAADLLHEVTKSETKNESAKQSMVNEAFTHEKSQAPIKSP